MVADEINIRKQTAAAAQSIINTFNLGSKAVCVCDSVSVRGVRVCFPLDPCQEWDEGLYPGNAMTHSGTGHPGPAYILCL